MSTSKTKKLSKVDEKAIEGIKKHFGRDNANTIINSGYIGRNTLIYAWKNKDTIKGFITRYTDVLAKLEIYNNLDTWYKVTTGYGYDNFEIKDYKVASIGSKFITYYRWGFSEHDKHREEFYESDWFDNKKEAFKEYKVRANKKLAELREEISKIKKTLARGI
jgi:hypothetical protein